MNHNTELARQDQLEALIPAHLKDGYGKRMLYVGGHLRYGRNLQMSAYFRAAGYTIDVIEVFPDNIVQLMNIKWIGRLIEGDVRLFLPYFTYDLVVFWHGPEHLPKEEVPALLDKMKTYANAVIFATPNGHYTQEEVYAEIMTILENNNWEKDKSYIFPDAFKAYLQQGRFKIITTVNIDSRNNHVIVKMIIYP